MHSRALVGQNRSFKIIFGFFDFFFFKSESLHYVTCLLKPTCYVYLLVRVTHGRIPSNHKASPWCSSSNVPNVQWACHRNLCYYRWLTYSVVKTTGRTKVMKMKVWELERKWVCYSYRHLMPCRWDFLIKKNNFWQAQC